MPPHPRLMARLPEDLLARGQGVVAALVGSTASGGIPRARGYAEEQTFPKRHSFGKVYDKNDYRNSTRVLHTSCDAITMPISIDTLYVFVYKRIKIYIVCR